MNKKTAGNIPTAGHSKIDNNFFFPIIIFILGISLLGLGLFCNAHYPRIDALTMNNGHSAAFHQKDNIDPLAPPSPQSIITVKNGTFSESVNLPSANSAVSISFIHYCQPTCERLWLFLDSDQKKSLAKTIIYDSTLEHLNWFYLESPYGYFYQKEPKYKSFNDLISSNPQASIITDDFIEKNVSLIDQSYLLSSYYSQGKFREVWNRYQTTVNIRNTNKLTYRIVYQGSQSIPPTIFLANINIKTISQ